MNALLEIKDLWGGYTEGVDILRGINMEVQQGEAVGIIGLNGSGKSTLGKAIMNMIPYRRGQILFNGEDITGLRTDQLAQRGIAIMQQGGRVFPNLSVWDNFQLAARFSHSQFSILDSQFVEIIPLLQRPKRELQHLMADKLSGGQCHQIALTMALVASPKIVILDEPSAGLSPKTAFFLYQILKKIRHISDTSFIIIEHDAFLVANICNLMVQISQGLINKGWKNVGFEVNQVNQNK